MPDEQVAERCDHADEIARLRAEVAQLRAKVEALTPSARPADVTPAQPATQAMLAAAIEIENDRVQADRAGLPYADHRSSDLAKIALYRALFVGRDDVYAYRWENLAAGEKGWAPRRRPGSRKESQDFLPLTDAVVAEHLRDNSQTAGLYVMLSDSTCRLLVCDFDDMTWQLDVAAYADVARTSGVPVSVEVSRSGQGAHAWTFFTEPVPASDARALGAALLREAMAARGELGLESYDRLFPSQDFMPKRGLGNLIALPLQGRNRRRDRTTLFVNTSTWQPYDDQFGYLSAVARLSRQAVTELGETMQPPTVGPAARLRRSPLSGEPPPPPVIKAQLAGTLAVRRAGLPPSLLASLKHLASLHNAEFHERQRMGFSVWNTPRFLRCYAETLEHLHLPRGVVDQARSIIEEAGSRLEVTDKRPRPAPLDLAFQGFLRDSGQHQAVHALACHELGVLVAPPGSGKTVMACALIAHHGVPTLVLVDRAPLLKQWHDRLRTFLGLSTDQVGQIGAGTSRRTGVVDLAMLQTLARAEDPAAMLDGYGMVVVDECHHVAAHTFEAAIKDIPARLWLGLTATPKRTDHREEIMLMHCGPIRHRVIDNNDLLRSLHLHPTDFELRNDIDGDLPGLLSSIILPALVADRARNESICQDIATAVEHGRNCLVLTGRTEHVDLLAHSLRERGLDPSTVHGQLKPRERRAVLETLAAVPATGPPLLVVATDRYIGEGFDCPRLDTVFLTFPISSEGPITQYVGRVLREYPGKLDAQIHDYADTKVPMLARMHGKRLTTFRGLGFTTAALTPPLPFDLTTNSPPVAATHDTPTPTQVRTWAKNAGLEVSDRGRLRAELWIAYQHAHSATELAT